MTEQCAVVSGAARPAPVVLGSWPTPLEPAPRLAVAVGLAADALWVKRDDLSGLGGGGNKVRKLQYTCAQALAAGATTVITSGAPQSNHARLTAAAAARLGLRSVLVLQGEEPEVPVGNLVLDLLAGARLVWTGPATAEQARREVERQAEKVRQDGGIPHVIPHGGYLRQLPVDIIKIDPSFVAGVGTDGTLAMLTRTIVQVGHDLGIEIVAEGIERPEQLELLRAHRLRTRSGVPRSQADGSARDRVAGRRRHGACRGSGCRFGSGRAAWSPS